MILQVSTTYIDVSNFRLLFFCPSLFLLVFFGILYFNVIITNKKKINKSFLSTAVDYPVENLNSDCVNLNFGFLSHIKRPSSWSVPCILIAYFLQFILCGSDRIRF